MNPDNWDWDNPVEVRVIGKPGAVLRVRFTQDEYLALARIAREAGVAPVTFIHQTMLKQIAEHQDSEKPLHRRPA